MKKIVFLLLTIMISCQMQAQQNEQYQTLPDPKHSEQNMLVGKITFAEIAKEPAYTWLTNNYEKYTTDSVTIKKLNEIIKPYTFVAFIGTWCEDTQNLLPAFYKVCKQLKIDNTALEMYGMDRDKKALNIEDKLYKIENLPTFIIYKNHREAGRIVETVNKSIEKDILNILEKDIETGKD